MIIRIHQECEDGIEKSVLRITAWHHEAYRVMTNGDCKGQIFLSHLHTNNGFFFLLTTRYRIDIRKHEKSFKKILNSLRCDMVTSFKYYNDVMDRCATVRFYLSHRLVLVCKIELSHMGKINRNPDLVCEKTSSNTECQSFLTAPHTNDGLFFFVTFQFHSFILTFLLLEIIMQLKYCLL